MRYFSTRSDKRSVTGTEAIIKGQAHDGGLYVPDIIPSLTSDEIAKLTELNYKELAFCITKLYLPEFSDAEIYEYVSGAYGNNFDTAEVAPIRTFDGFSFLELWHGPTCAFKDMALQLLPRLMTASLNKTGETKRTAVLVATSGDTGKAALEGFCDVSGTSITVFYPRDGVSDIQKLQMVTQKGSNVNVCAVEGNFDDTQNGVKAIFADSVLRDELDRAGIMLSSANSINWGRLLPQIVYYFFAYLSLVRSGGVNHGNQVNFCVPTGNFGNILAGYIAKSMGLPVRKLICASNSNNVLADFINTGHYDKRRELITTISPSMDILISSNLERLLYLCSGRDTELISQLMSDLTKRGHYSIDESLRSGITSNFTCGWADETATKKAIAHVYNTYGYLIDPHTAVAYDVLANLSDDDEVSDVHTIIISTASPYKFSADVLDALGAKCGTDPISTLSGITKTPVPAQLSELSGLPVRFTDSVIKENMHNYIRTLTESGKL